MRWTTPSLVFVAALIGCDHQSQGITEPLAPAYSSVAKKPHFVRFDPALFTIAQRRASVVAVKGATAYLKLRYLTPQQDNDKEVFLDLEIGGSSLWKRPDGSLIMDGDTVTISVEVDPDGFFAFKFEPAGLQFDPKARPKLRLWCFNPGNKLKDDDGDDYANPGLSIWVSEDNSTPWSRANGAWLKVQKGTLESWAYLNGFTRFAMAMN